MLLASLLHGRQSEIRHSTGWDLVAVEGRLTELSGHGASAVLTLAFGLILDAQIRGEPVAWVTAHASTFYPPDAADGGVDLDTLAVVRLHDAAMVPRAAAELARSGAFGLVVIDLGVQPRLSPAQLAQLEGLARRHGTAIVCVVDKPPEAPSLGSLVSLRADAGRRRHPDGGFVCGLYVIKDKRRGPGWSHEEMCRGPAGLR